MRSIKMLAGSAVVGAALALTVPVTARAAPMVSPCEQAKSTALEAEDDYEAAKKQYDDGDESLKKQVEEAEQNANMLASEAQRICGDTVMDSTGPGHEPEHKGGQTHPRGAMHTGVGGSSDGNGTGVAVGVGTVGVLAAGVLLAGRRRADGRV
jgi:hypothetical protein